MTVIVSNQVLIAQLSGLKNRNETRANLIPFALNAISPLQNLVNMIG